MIRTRKNLDSGTGDTVRRERVNGQKMRVWGAMQVMRVVALLLGTVPLPHSMQFTRLTDSKRASRH
jgi:hypothetical protein